LQRIQYDWPDIIGSLILVALPIHLECPLLTPSPSSLSLHSSPYCASRTRQQYNNRKITNDFTVGDASPYLGLACVGWTLDVFWTHGHTLRYATPPNAISKQRSLRAANATVVAADKRAVMCPKALSLGCTALPPRCRVALPNCTGARHDAQRA
jgi:hypothetical protein